MIGPMIELGFWVLLFATGIVLVMGAFPEVTMWLIVMAYAGGMGDQFKLDYGIDKPSHIFYDWVKFIWQATRDYPAWLMWTIALGIPILWLGLAHFVHIGWLYPFKILGVILAIGCLWLWLIALTNDTNNGHMPPLLMAGGVGVSVIVAGIRIAFQNWVDDWLPQRPIRFKQQTQNFDQQETFDAQKEQFEQEKTQATYFDEPTSYDPYQVLGVSPDDDLETIKRVYRTVSKAYHPDTNPSQVAEEKMKEINTAWDEIQRDRG
jgi:hypothetical protein